MDAVSRIGGSRGLIGVRMRTRNLIRGHAANKCGADHLRRRYVAKVRVHGVRRAPSTAADPTVTFSTAPDLVDYSSFSFKRPAPGPPRLPGGKARRSILRASGLLKVPRAEACRQGSRREVRGLPQTGKRRPPGASVHGYTVTGLGQEPGTGMWLARNLNLTPGS